MKKIVKIAIYALLAIVLIAAVGITIWSQQTYKPSAELNELVTSEDYRLVDGNYIFEPEENAEMGIIIYPGAKVEPLAYGYLAKQLTEEGYFVAIPQLRLNMSVFESSAAKPIIDEYTDVSRWIVGGHSLGGVSASSFVGKNPEHIAGVFFLASYPADSSDFSKSTLPMLSIYAENDLLSTPSDISDKQKLLSSTAVLHEIQGGNHAGFGMYGKQKDDGEATISNVDQQNKIVEQITKWLESVKGENL